MLLTNHQNCPRILILGAGCTGLGAAYRLQELGHTNFHIIEQHSYPGGLAASFVDDKGFTWDLGGHVQFSHYAYFDRLMNLALGAQWLRHVRESYIWIRGRFVPYPFQNNLRHLPPKDLVLCINGLLRARSGSQPAPSDFRDWILQSFGTGIADLFLCPYNFKVWAHLPEMMDYRWVGERVATVDLERVIENVILNQDDPGWGPNNTFQFPARGGTGAIWRAVASLIPQTHFTYNTEVLRIHHAQRTLLTSDGREHAYDFLISTLPLDLLASLVDLDDLESSSRHLRYATTHVVGLGLAGQPPECLATKNWMYFPEGDCPFYRVTVFSNYSPANVPNPVRFWSLMAEVSESRFKPVDEKALLPEVIRGMLATGLIKSESDIVSTWSQRIQRGYPVPTVGRDNHLQRLFSRLEEEGIYSRGRFGAWKYEVSNQDHACMQGVEAANHLLFGVPEMTLNYPAVVNQAPVRKSAGCHS